MMKPSRFKLCEFRPKEFEKPQRFGKNKKLNTGLDHMFNFFIMYISMWITLQIQHLQLS